MADNRLVFNNPALLLTKPTSEQKIRSSGGRELEKQRAERFESYRYRAFERGSQLLGQVSALPPFPRQNIIPRSNSEPF